jgi:hypothetical protein
VLLTPTETYAEIAARPRVAGAMATVVLISAGAVGGFLSTEVGQLAALDQQMAVMESFDIHLNDAQYAAMESRMHLAAYFGVAGQLITLPLLACMVAGVLIGVFNVALGGDATYGEVLAIVAHSGFVILLQTLFVVPLNYARESMANPASLAVFFPMLDDTGFAARLLGALDLFRIWWLLSLSIGLAVLYRRRSGPIAVGLLVVYALVAVAVAAVMTAFSGA